MNPLELTWCIFLALTVANYWKLRSVLYPPFIFSLMWLLVLSIDCLHLIRVNQVHSDTLAIVTGAAIAFSIGGWVATLIPCGLLRIHLFPKSSSGADFVRTVLLVILLCGLPIMFYQVLQLARGGSGIGILMRARQAEVEAARSGEPIHSVVLDYFVFTASMASLLFASEKTDRKFWIATIVAFIGCILSTGRTSLLLLIGGLSAIRLLRTKHESISGAVRLLRWPFALFIALYVGLIFTNKNTTGMAGGATGIITYFVLSYMAGPLSAFDGVVQDPLAYNSFGHTFEFPMKVASALNLTSYTPPPKFDTFVMVPFPTNVYTVFKFYFLDLGSSGTIALFLLIGFLHSALYLKARHGGRLSRFLFAFSVYSVVMVIFDDAYYTVGLYLRAFVFGWFYCMLTSTRLNLSPHGKTDVTEMAT